MPDTNPNLMAVTIQQELELALQHHHAGRLAEAEAIYRQILARQPDHADALHLLGVIAHQREQHQLAVELIGQAIVINPQKAIYHNNLGLTLMSQNRIAAAIGAYQAALRIEPGNAYVHNNMGVALEADGQVDAAIKAYQTTIGFKADYSEAYNNLGNALAAQGHSGAAADAYHEALRLKPDHADAWNNLGNLLRNQGRLDEANRAYRQAIRVKPDFSMAYENLGGVLKDQGQLEEAIGAYRAALRLKPDDPSAHSNIIYSMYFHPGYDARAIYEEQIQWNRRCAAPLKKFIKPHTNDPSPDRRLRIGYVSPNFYAQAESFFLTPLLEAHDHGPFEVHCYSDVRRPDHITERIRRSVDVWHHVPDKSDADLARQIREDQIDILIDLTMHMPHNRLPVFARKSAPVQVTWLAYPGTTGLDAIDYRISDAFMDPPDVPTPYYPEETIRLPDFWCCYDPLSKADTAPRAPRQDGPICFGSLNNPCKHNDQVLGLWSKVLEATRDSRLLMLAFSAEHQNHIRMVFERADIGTGRLIFVRRCPRDQYLRLYDRIDVVLDPLPYNGITTTLDALWMGVPVISLAGSTAAGRAGLGILTTLGMPELAAHSPEQLVQIAPALAGDLPRLAELRSTLRQRMQASPLMDASRFARNIEAAYREMWRKWCKKQEE
jgi:protein O-GlcNAc transferase